MKFSEFTPPVIYINVPDAVIVQDTEAAKHYRSVLMQSLDELGIAVVTLQDILSAAYIAIEDAEQTMPFSDINAGQAPKNQNAAINKVREEFVRTVLAKVSIKTSGSTTQYYLNQENITHRIAPCFFSDSAYRQTWINGVNEYLSNVLNTQKFDRPIAFVAVDPHRMTKDKLTPAIGVILDKDESFRSQDGQEVRLRKKVDTIIPLTTNAAAFKQKINDVVTYFTDLREKSVTLRAEIASGAIELEEQFDRDTWPGFALMNNVKHDVRAVVLEVIKEKNVLCDALDLEYQTLFRLTSLPIAEVFKHGEQLEEYLREQHAYDYWRNILALDPEKLNYPIRTAVVRKIAEEQLLIIQERIQNTPLPLDTLLIRDGIFAEPDWKLQKYGGKLSAIRVQDGRVVDSKEVSFRPVDPAYARELHSVLHYIHTPRCIMAFGLYLEDDELPFSVVAFDEIDRPYKKDLLFMYGYNPEKCLDLARLYSRPGTPFNTSSTIFTLAFTYFKENKPEVQAILSAFMPTYAHGMSMISAGFNYGVLVKEWRHSFAERTINGKTAWELVTKRRVDESQTIIDSQWPLLPVFELMATLQAPRFTPLNELSGMMVSRHLPKKAAQTSSVGS